MKHDLETLACIEVKRCGNHWAVESYMGGERPPKWECFNEKKEALEHAKRVWILSPKGTKVKVNGKRGN